MGFLAQSAWIIRVFAALLIALSPGLAAASATALGVTLDASAGCGNGRIDVSLTAAGANREGWRATNVAGATLVQGEGPTGFTTGTFNGFFPQVFSPSQPAGTRVGSYAYVGDTPPDAVTRTCMTNGAVSNSSCPPGHVSAAASITSRELVAISSRKPSG